MAAGGACGTSTPSGHVTSPSGESAPAPPSAVDALIRVESPQPMAQIASPLEVRGEARGSWYFEADFPVRLLASDGHLLVATHAHAQREWMTEAFVPFAATLTFDVSGLSEGTLVLERANPSGLSEHAGELRITVRFAAARSLP
jgi:Immunoglobulin-like domain of bacterial spore germination